MVGTPVADVPADVLAELVLDVVVDVGGVYDDCQLSAAGFGRILL